ncbi:MAG: HlyD family efflux transporter periplasmic adaptor subunit [Bryobacterales bacterium]|nr:HlyD family efflux transporter periplasmic adaptor subunit [Bryobacterales bacterium]
MKKIIRIVVPLLVLAAIAVALLRSNLFRKEEINVIRLSGNIEMTQVDIAFKVPGRIVELNVKEGSAVEKGEVVARIDRLTMESQKAREMAGVDAATAMLSQIVTAIEYQRQAIDGDLALRQAELRAAESRVAELLAGSRSQEIAAAKAQLADMRTWAGQAKRDWERAQALFQNEDISAAQYEQFRAKHESTAQATRQAEERLALLEEGPRKETIDQARAQVERAKAAIRLAETNRLELKRREQELAVRRAEIGRAKAGVAIIDAQLEDTAAASPIGGVVMVKSAENGEIVAAGAVVATIGDLRHPWLRAYIGERDLGRIKIGTEVKLSTDSFPGKVYLGRISFIATEAEFTPKQIQTEDERVKLVYRIKVDVDNPNQELKANMPVAAEIVL